MLDLVAPDIVSTVVDCFSIIDVDTGNHAFSKYEGVSLFSLISILVIMLSLTVTSTLRPVLYPKATPL